uniref:Ion transport domain-containing protein n=1 Tax=Dunaliella tertiolecta TaxID=3047 RepID=A0A7S3R5P2_DUNTE
MPKALDVAASLLAQRSQKVVPIDEADTFFGMPDQFNQLEEARYPTQCAHGCLALRVPDPPVYALPAVVNISKDGKIAAVGGKDVELFLWSTETGELLSTLRGHETSWTGSNDSTFFVTTQEDSKVMIWDQQKIQLRMLLGHPDEVLTCCSISLDDEYVVVGGLDGSLYSWDVRTGIENTEFFGGHEGPVATTMCFPMADGSHIIISCGREDRRIAVWDIESGKQLYSIEVEELKDAKIFGYHISKEQIQVLVWCKDSVPFPNLVFVDPLSGNRACVHCHGGAVMHATFMKQASRIVTAGGDGKAIIWDTETLEPCMTLEGHKGAVYSCAVNEEGTSIVTGGEDCTIRVWNAEDGKQIRMMLAQNDPIRFCSYAKSPVESKIITCDNVGRVHVWSTVVEVLNSLLRRFADALSCVTTSSDNALIAAGCNNGRVMLWDTKARTNVWEFTHHTGRVEDIAFNTLREMLVTSGQDGHVVVMSVKTGKQVKQFLTGSEPVMRVIFSPDDDRLAGLCDGSVVLFKVDQEEVLPALTLRTGAGRVVSLVWSPNSKTVLGSCSDGNVMVWSASTGSIFSALNGDAATTCLSVDLVGKVLAVGNVLGRTKIYVLETSEQLLELRSNASAVREVIFNQDTTRLTTVCSRQAITWDLATAAQVRVFDFVVEKGDSYFHSVPDRVRACYCHWGSILFDHESETATFDMVPPEDHLLRSQYLSDTRGIISGNTGIRRIILWSAADAPLPDKMHTTHDAITSCHFSADDRLLAMGTQDGSLIVYDTMHNDVLEVIQAHLSGPCKCVRMSHDAKYVLTSGVDGSVLLWDWRERETVQQYYCHLASVGCCDMALHGRRVASGDSEGMLCVFERETADLVLSMKEAHPMGVISLSLSADGSTVASVGSEGKVSMWHVDMGVELMTLETAVLSKPLYCAFSPDDSKLAITETSGAVMVWNVVAGCQWYLIPHAHTGTTVACSWSFNSRHLVSAGLDGDMAMWDAESGAPLLKMPVKSGALTTCSISPNSMYVATGSISGTLAVHNVHSIMKHLPEPSFLYSWLDYYEYKKMVLLLKKLFKAWPYLYNIQDAQGWSLVSNAIGNGNAKVTSILMEALETVEQPAIGLICAIPSSQISRIVLERSEEDALGIADNAGPGIPRILQQIKAAEGWVRSQGSVGPGIPTYRNDSDEAFEEDDHALWTAKGKKGPKRSAASVAAKRMKRRGQGNKVVPFDETDEFYDENVAGRAKSFNVQAKKATVELLMEKRKLNFTELTLNNVLAMALNSKSSKCVQAVLDITAAKKVSFGSFHAITDMMPALSSRYPYMCFRFLAELDLMTLGALEVPVDSLKNSNSLIRTAPIFTNIQDLWAGHLHQVRPGPQPYTYVQAKMVRLPYACAIGPDSLLQSLVESDVPVQAFSTPSVHSVIRHKWHLYGRTCILTRFVIYLFYTLVLTVFAILYSKEDHSLTLPEYWDSGPQGRFHIIATGYLCIQALWYIYMEARQMWAIQYQAYFKSAWNVLDLASTLMMVAVAILQLTRTGTLADQQDRAVAPMIAFTLILTYFKLFFYALAFEPTGPVVHMLFQLGLAVRNWVVLMFANILAFGTALQVLAQYTSKDDQHTNFGRSLFSLWQSLFGQFQLDSMRTDGAWPEVSIVLYNLWLFVSSIILLSMLIVMMREYYRDIRDHEKDVFLRGRAQLIVEVETLMSQRERDRYTLMPPFLHMLSLVQRNMLSMHSLIGRLGALDHFLETIRLNLIDAAAEIGRLQGGTFGQRRVVAAPALAPQLAMPRKDEKWGGPNDKDDDPGGNGDVGKPRITKKEWLALLKVLMKRVRDTESQLPAVQRQVDRLQRSINEQEMRIEGMVVVLRNLEEILRNQKPTSIPVAQRRVRRPNAMSEAELEREVRRLLGAGGPPPTLPNLLSPDTSAVAPAALGAAMGSDTAPRKETPGKGVVTLPPLAPALQPAPDAAPDAATPGTPGAVPDPFAQAPLPGALASPGADQATAAQDPYIPGPPASFQRTSTQASSSPGDPSAAQGTAAPLTAPQGEAKEASPGQSSPEAPDAGGASQGQGGSPEAPGAEGAPAQDLPQPASPASGPDTTACPPDAASPPFAPADSSPPASAASPPALVTSHPAPETSPPAPSATSPPQSQGGSSEAPGAEGDPAQDAPQAASPASGPDASASPLAAAPPPQGSEALGALGAEGAPAQDAAQAASPPAPSATPPPTTSRPSPAVRAVSRGLGVSGARPFSSPASRASSRGTDSQAPRPAGPGNADAAGATSPMPTLARAGSLQQDSRDAAADGASTGGSGEMSVGARPSAGSHGTGTEAWT